MFLGTALAATLMGLVPQAAAADIAAPVIVPPPAGTGLANVGESPACIPKDATPCLLPDLGAVVDWPDANLLTVWPYPRAFILSKPGLSAQFLGELRVENAFPVIWHDVGSGTPVTAANGNEFPLAGVYSWECFTCGGIIRNKLQGTMYVIGPRAIMKPSLAAPDNTGATVTYKFDGSGSFVTDYTPHSITQYAFDFDDDGVYDQVSPEPTAQASLAPGPHTIRLRVTDDTGRTGEWPLFLEIPYVRPPNPEPNPIADNTKGSDLTTGVNFGTTKVKLTAVKRIRVKVLRSRGLTVKVTGLSRGDRVKARLLSGKKAVVASGGGTSTSSTKTVRLRVSAPGQRILKAKPKSKRLVLDVAVEGTDGFQVTKRAAVRVS